MKHLKRNLLTIAASLLLCAGCSTRPENVLSDADMAELLADLHIADAYNSIGAEGFINNADGDSVRKVLRQSVFKSHGVTEAQFDTTLGWYGRNLDKYEEMYEMVMVDIEEKKKALAEREQRPAQPTLWPYGPNQRLSSGPEGRLLPFEVSGAKVPKGAKLIWEAKTINASKPMELFMAVEYADGSLGYVLRNMMGGGRQNITLQTDSQKNVKKMYGYLRLKEAANVLLDSISLMAAPLNRNSYYEVHSVQIWQPRTGRKAEGRQ